MYLLFVRWQASQCHLPSGGETDIFEVDTRTAVDQRKHRNVVLLLILLFNTLVGRSDKLVKSKSGFRAPPALFIGSIQDTKKKNRRSRFQITPWTRQKTILTLPRPPQ